MLYPVQGRLMVTEALSATEVAALAGLDEGRVRKDVEYGIFSRPSFSFDDLVYFFAVAVLGVQLGVDDRKKLHEVIASAMSKRQRPPRVDISPVLEMRLDRIASDAEGKLGRFEAWKKSRVVTDERVLGGEPTFPKSRLAVRHVGGMILKGASTDELLGDYPYLKDDDIEFAPVYTRAYPRMGRPRERQTATR
jgi:uncharacterized protein (DUF433 family)